MSYVIVDRWGDDGRPAGVSRVFATLEDAQASGISGAIINAGPKEARNWLRDPGTGGVSYSPKVDTPQEAAAAIGIPKKVPFCMGVRSVYNAGAQPLGAIPPGVAVPDWLTAIIASLDDVGDDAVITTAQKEEALDRWVGSDSVEYANPLLQLLRPILGFSADDLAQAFITGKTFT